MSNPNTADWLQTASGRLVCVTAPDPKDICIEDIAHALGNLCRFGGHVRSFYSVAEHSVLVSRIAEREARIPFSSGAAGSTWGLYGLLHDAAEAYLQDIIRPVKRNIGPSYDVLERRMLRAISVRFNLPTMGFNLPTMAWYEDQRVVWADRVALMTERRDLLVPTGSTWSEDTDGVPACSYLNVVPLSPDGARRAFLNRFMELMP